MTSVIQVTNVSPSATNEQVQTLFAFLGAIDSMALYPLTQDPANPITKVAFVKFSDPDSVNPAQHLTNTVFIDRALICTCYDEGSARLQDLVYEKVDLTDLTITDHINE